MNFELFEPENLKWTLRNKKERDLGSDKNS